MKQPPLQRLPSFHLEDLAYVALSAHSSAEPIDPYPKISDETRLRIRSRIKQLGKYSWPSSLREDPALKTGHTLQQCYRLVVALLLLDAYIPPSIVVMLVSNNELNFLNAIASRLTEPCNSAASPEDLLAVIIPGEIRQASDVSQWLSLESERVRLILRKNVEELWTGDLAGGGARLTVDVAMAAGAVWQWISGRRLMTGVALETLLDEIRAQQDEPGFTLIKPRVQRRP